MDAGAWGAGGAGEDGVGGRCLFAGVAVGAFVGEDFSAGVECEDLVGVAAGGSIGAGAEFF